MKKTMHLARPASATTTVAALRRIKRQYCVRSASCTPARLDPGGLLSGFLFDRAMKKLEESLHFLQRHEEKLWFWGVDRAEDLGFSAEFSRKRVSTWTAATNFPQSRQPLRRA